MKTTVFGIRHHGPGCARSLDAALAELRPDVVLVEGPPDADELIPLVAAEGMRPPVAILTWRVDDSRRAAFHPFAEFSPEWRALRYATLHGAAARFCDLPLAYALAAPAEDDAEDDAASAERDPLLRLAEADGYDDGERWWNDRVEESGGDARFFEAAGAAVAAVRAELALPETARTLRREAWMRRSIRAAAQDGFQNAAVVVGAWHAPALTGSTASADAAVLKGLPKTKVRSTWTPWTYERLTRASGYGAGISAPGWYEHLFASGADAAPRWLVRAARALRDEDLPTSSASAIDAARLATALAGLRGRPAVGLAELDAAIGAVFCRGDAAPRRLLEKPLFVGERMGELPPDAPRPPLEEDLLAEARSLRLKQTGGDVALELDLREDSGRARSAFLHRLRAIDVAWGAKVDAGRSRGTFKEVWTLRWKPEFALAIVDASAFGNTVVEAATGRLARDAGAAESLAALVPLLEAALLGDLPAATGPLLGACRDRSARTHDVAALLEAAPPLVRLARYGDVRATDRDAVRAMLRTLTVRAHLGLTAAASGIDDEAAEKLGALVRAHHAGLRNLADEETLADADAAFRRVADAETAHALLRGLAVRLLRARGAITEDEAALRLRRELSTGAPPAEAAAWIEGFLGGQGQELVHDARLLDAMDAWVGGLSDDAFHAVLPLVRRTMGAFAAAERAQIAQRLRARRSGAPRAAEDAPPTSLDAARAIPATAALARLFELPPPEAAP